MDFSHNELAHRAIRMLLSQLRQGQAHWATDRLTQYATLFQGLPDWPRPDGALHDPNTNSSLAVEFKPPGQSKREYVTGIGQAITYLRNFEYAALIVPKLAGDGYEISRYLQANLSEPFASALPVALFDYENDPSQLRALINLRPRQGPPPSGLRGIRKKIFWAYWRDLSNYDLFDLLDTIYSKNTTFEHSFKTFWNQKMIRGRARTWEGTNRKPRKQTPKGYTGERTNVNLSMRHIGVIDSDGRLTDDGLKLLHKGKVYGASSLAFLNGLGRLVLGNGRHLELIFWVEDQQRDFSQKALAKQFYHNLDRALQRAGIIASAPVNRSKATFLRDEQKLWNKLGLLKRSRGRQYFHVGTGLVFDWQTIISRIESE